MEPSAGPDGRYRLIDPVGATRFASLWRGEDTSTGERVLLQVIRDAPPPDAERRWVLVDALHAAARLPFHPSLLRVRSVHTPEPRDGGGIQAGARGRRPTDVDRERWLLVLDPFDGSTLQRWTLLRHVDPAVLFGVGVDVGEALWVLHRVGLSHGAISSASVLVSDNGQVRVTDAVVGRWWTLPGTSVADRQAQDVHDLARLMAEVVPADALPPAVGEIADGSASAWTSLELLLPVLRAARDTAASSSSPVVSLPDPEEERSDPPDGSAIRRMEPTAVAARATTDVAVDLVREAPRSRRPADDDIEHIVQLPGSPRIDRATSAQATPEHRVPTSRPKERRRRTAPTDPRDPLRPARWMTAVAIVASMVMFAALGFGAYLLLRDLV